MSNIEAMVPRKHGKKCPVIWTLGSIAKILAKSLGGQHNCNFFLVQKLTIFLPCAQVALDTCVHVLPHSISILGLQKSVRFWGQSGEHRVGVVIEVVFINVVGDVIDVEGFHHLRMHARCYKRVLLQDKGGRCRHPSCLFLYLFICILVSFGSTFIELHRFLRPRCDYITRNTLCCRIDNLVSILLPTVSHAPHLSARACRHLLSRRDGETTRRWGSFPCSTLIRDRISVGPPRSSLNTRPGRESVYLENDRELMPKLYLGSK